MASSKLFPTTRYFNSVYYHPFGSTPPEDYLQSITDSIPTPRVLVLGCGDIRSCFYTIWNNFDPQHSRTFYGVDFILNDSSEAVMARNVLFLYLCTETPPLPIAGKKWIASIWSIWFCHELLPAHHKVLMSALSKLVEWSNDESSWSNENPLRHFVEFVTPSTLEKLNKVWRKWINRTLIAEEMNMEKMKSFQSIQDSKPIENRTADVLKQCLGSAKVENLSFEKKQAMEKEISSYYKSGNAYAEKVLGIAMEETVQTYYNNSFIERRDNTYTIPHDSIPYNCFYHNLQFSPGCMRMLGHYYVVEGKEFDGTPLLANSVQQFSIWIQSCASTFNKKRGLVKFGIKCSDALEFCHQLCNDPSSSQFDAVHTSNLMDFTAPPSLVILALSVLRGIRTSSPLAKKCCGFLFTTSFCCTNTANNFLREMFGFDCEYLPVLIGARCLNVEGEYSGEVCLKPEPYDPESSRTTFIWQRVTPTLPTQVSKENLHKMFEILCNAIVHIVGYPLQNGGKLRSKIPLMCTETAILMLQSFVAQLDPKSYDDAYGSFQFWKPFSTMLLDQKCMKVFHSSLETHALLHGLHLHLTVSKDACHICCSRAASDFIKQCTVSIDHEELDYNEPRYVAVLHKGHSYGTGGKFISGDDDDVHVFDCLAGWEADKALKFYFCFPQRLDFEEYNLTVLSMNFDREVPISVVKILNKQVGDVAYTFKSNADRCIGLPTQSELIFGELVEHHGNVDRFDSVVRMSDETKSVYSQFNELYTTSLFSSPLFVELKIYTGNYKEIFYPYPVAISTSVSEEKGTVHVEAHRKKGCLYEESPAFVVNPDNTLAMPGTRDSQLSQEDRAPLNTLGQSTCHLLAEVSIAVSRFFQKKKSCFLLSQTGSLPSVVGLVAVRDQLFDVANKTPAVDLYFCFMPKQYYKQFHEKWRKFYTRISFTNEEITLKNTGCETLKKLLEHFARCTAATTIKNEDLVDVQIEKLSKFTRAVVYPLYPHKDFILAASGPVVKLQCSTKPVQ